MERPEVAELVPAVPAVIEAVLNEPPSDVEEPLMVIAELESLLFAIDPASIAFVTFPLPMETEIEVVPLPDTSPERVMLWLPVRKFARLYAVLLVPVSVNSLQVGADVVPFPINTLLAAPPAVGA